MTIRAVPLPSDALLQTFAKRSDCYTDCYATEVQGAVTFPDFVTTFYCTRLFRAERFVLRLTMGARDTDADVAALAQGQSDRFAVWEVEERAPNQLLLRDKVGGTRSWFLTRPAGGKTEIFFGSAVVPATEGAELGFLVRALTPLHKLYSRRLLAAARRMLT